MKKNQLKAIVFSAGILFTACSTPEEQATTNAETPKENIVSSGIKKSSLQLMAVSSQDKTVEVMVSGRVIPKNTTTLFAEVQGRLKPTRLNFKAGASFSKGQPLIDVDALEFALNLESQRSSFLNTLTAMMPDLKEDYSSNYEAWLDYVEAYEVGSRLKALPEVKNNSEKYFVTSRGVYSSYYAIKALEERLSKYTIVAPYSGIITQSQVDMGSLVSPGQPLGQIISTEGYEIETGVALEVANQLEPGTRLEFTSNQLDGSWTGTVTRIGGTVDSKTQNVLVYFSVSGAKLKPGMYLEGKINTQDFEEVFVLHSSAIARDETVLVLDKDLIRKKQVEPVEYLNDSILVRGLKDQDQIILNQFPEPVEGQKVSIQ